MTQFNRQQKYEEAMRECRYRRLVYKRLVDNLKMTPEQAEHKIAVMAEIAEDYRDDLFSAPSPYRTLAKLAAISEVTRDYHAYWADRTGKPEKAPYRGDAPCYYCGWNNQDAQFKDERVTTGDACNWCIHNPDSLLFRG